MAVKSIIHYVTLKCTHKIINLSDKYLESEITTKLKLLLMDRTSPGSSNPSSVIIILNSLPAKVNEERRDFLKIICNKTRTIDHCAAAVLQAKFATLKGLLTGKKYYVLLQTIISK